MGLPINFNPYAPIPNNPFFYAQTNSLSSIAGPLVVGTGFTINYATGVISVSGGGGGATTWATLGDKNNASGPTEIALGLDAGTAQGLGAIAIGATAGNSGQASGATALGGGAGVTNQGANAVAIGQSAGISDQGTEALALGSQAGTTSQAACSIVINATGAPLENTASNTTVIAPVRNASTTGLPVGFKQVAYNPATGELVYYS
jgi:hypothetical protein